MAKAPFRFENYQALFFDFDGVVLASLDVKADAISELFRSHGPEFMARVKAYQHEHPGVSRYEKFEVIYRSFLGQALTPADRDRLDREMSALVLKKIAVVPFVPGMPDFLAEVSKKFPCHLLSATPEAELRKIVEVRGLTAYFRDICGSPQKKTESMRLIVGREGYTPGRCLMIGDAQTDLEAARAGGLDFLGVGLQWGGPSVPDFTKNSILGLVSGPAVVQ